jgi:predicted nuclease with TOPRIM domain
MSLEAGLNYRIGSTGLTEALRDLREGTTMEQKLQKRLEELKKEFEAGQARLREVETEGAYIRETMLRISGAIQVLEEALARETKPDEPAAADTPAAEKASGTPS